MSNLSLVILCGQSPRHLYVANRLCRAGKPLAIIQETGSELSPRRLLKLASEPARFLRKAWRWLRDRKRYRGNKEAGFFFGDQPPSLDRPDLRSTVPHINHPDTEALVRELDPDLVAVFGTSLIRPPLLGLGRLGMVNLHGGLSPHYRGADCTFWALHNGQPDQVGCTLHFINAGIDTGDLIAHVCPEVREGDDELTLFWRAVRDSAEAYAELCERLEAGTRFGCSQKEKGRLYQVKDRGWRHERALDAKLRSGLLNGLNLPLRVRWFTADT